MRMAPTLVDWKHMVQQFEEKRADRYKHFQNKMDDPQQPDTIHTVFIPSDDRHHEIDSSGHNVALDSYGCYYFVCTPQEFKKYLEKNDLTTSEYRDEDLGVTFRHLMKGDRGYGSYYISKTDRNETHEIMKDTY